MKIGEKKEFLGNSYTTIPYTEPPADFIPIDDDVQCKVCEIEPNYCKMMEECHGLPAFIFIKTEYAKAMNGLR